jgi:hypothetical protein
MPGDARYSRWIHTQPCAVCDTTLQVEGHHSLYGTTYSPEDARPTKAIEGARKGMAQKSHDYFLIPLCLKHHEPGIHQLGNYFEGWSRAEANAWEEEQVGIHRNRYAMQAPAPAAAPARATRPVKATSSLERERVLEQIETWAGARRLKAEEHQLIHDLVNDLRAESPGKQF